MKIDQRSTNNSKTKKSSKKTIIMTKTLSNKYMIINIILNDRKLRIILNLSVLKNSGNILDKITIMLKIDEHRKKITLNIVDLINYDVILNIS